MLISDDGNSFAEIKSEKQNLGCHSLLFGLPGSGTFTRLDVKSMRDVVMVACVQPTTCERRAVASDVSAQLIDYIRAFC